MAFALFASCTNEIDMYDADKDISFTTSISKDNGISDTKSSTAFCNIPFGDGMTLSIEESDIPDASENCLTKGMVLDSENFTEMVGKYGRLLIASFNKNGNPSIEYFNDIFKHYGNKWEPVRTTVKWPDFPLEIFAFAAIKGYYDDYGTYIDGYADEIVDNYVDLRTLAKKRVLTYRSDCYSEDLLYAKAEVPANYSGSFNLNFRHILTAIKFNTSANIPSGTVKKITIKGIPYSYSSGNAFDTTAEKWEELPDDEEEIGTYDIYFWPNVETESGVSGQALTNEYHTMFIVPQICREGMNIEIKFQYTGEEEVRTFNIPLESFEFKMGKQVTFSIGGSNS